MPIRTSRKTGSSASSIQAKANFEAQPILLRRVGKLFRHLETRKNVHHGIVAGVNVSCGHGNRRMPRDPRQSPGIAARFTKPREKGMPESVEDEGTPIQ